MKGRLVVVSLLAVVMTALGISVVFAGNYPTFDKEAPRLDAEAYLQMGGPNGEKFITSGPDYDRVQAVAKKLGCPYQVYVVRNDVFNACAAVTRIFVNRGAVNKCTTNSRLAAVIAHEETHIAHEHLRNQYEKQVRDAERLELDLWYLRKGDPSNAKLGQKIGKPLLKLASLHYSREDENDADLSGFALLKEHGYNVQDALGIFDMMGSGPKGAMGWFVTHPAPDKRKSRVIAGLPSVKAPIITVAPPAPAKKTVALWKVGNGASFAKMVASQDFSGCAYRMVMKEGPVYIFAKGSGEMVEERNTISLPKNAGNVVFLVMNPKPANQLGLRVVTASDRTGTNFVFHCDLLQDGPAEYLAAQVPVSALLAEDSFGIWVYFGKSSGSSWTKEMLSDASKFAYRFHGVSFRQ